MQQTLDTRHRMIVHQAKLQLGQYQDCQSTDRQPGVENQAEKVPRPTRHKRLNIINRCGERTDAH